MTYDAQENSIQDGEPVFYYAFVSGETVWRFTSAPDEILLYGETWVPSPISHSDISTTNEMERDGVDLTFPRTDSFANQFLGYTPDLVTSLTIYRKHLSSDDHLVFWKGRVLGSKSEGQRIIIECESIFSSMRRAGLRARYQRTCRHVLYSRGCFLDKDDFAVAVRVTAMSANKTTLTLSSYDIITDVVRSIPIVNYISGITLGVTTDVVLVAGTALKVGDVVTVTDVVGTTELNNNDYTVIVVTSPNIITIDVDSTSFTPYVSSGLVTAARTLTKLIITNTGLSSGDSTEISQIVGTTELNGNTYTVVYISDDEILIDVDSTGFTPYISGGLSRLVQETHESDTAWYLGGMVQYNGILRLIIGHTGSQITLSRPIEGIAVGESVQIYAGCNRFVYTCTEKFDNLLNFGGFPWIPTTNPFEFSPIV